MILPPSYHNGFAPRDGQAIWPELWRGCVGAWNPGLGPTGLQLYDWSPYKNHGTLTSMDAGTDWVASQGRYALDLDGSNDFINATNSSRFSFTPNSGFTLSVWANLNSLPGSSIFGLLGKGAYGSNLEYNFYIGEVFNQVRFTVANGSPNTAYIGRATSAIASVNWAHYAARYDGSGTSGGCSIWINGARADNANHQFGSYSAMANLGAIVSIGALNSGTNFRMSGRVGSSAVFNRPMHPNEISLLATRPGIAYEMAPRSWSAEQIAAYRQRQYSQLVGGGVI